MRKFVLLAACLSFLFACNNEKTGETIDSRSDSTGTSKQITYAYTPKTMPNWEVGDPENAAMVLKSLKAYEMGNVDESLSYFADSVEFLADGYYFHGTKDSLVKIMKAERDGIKEMTIDMHDWESVHGKSNGENWVSLWYMTKWTDKAGKVDSVIEMDDAKIVNGKIRQLDIKTRHFPKK
ncbi:MAG TPA: hypothetical protein VJT83_03450 [Chitinophagaceae bacterium]|nr:hypothetical protein [Chitinophagaceae bacterium]